MDVSIDDAGQAKHQAEPTRGGVSRTTLIVSVLLAALVAGVAGVAVGWKVEQERVKEDVENIRPIGVVRSSDEGSVTIRLLTSNGRRTFAITDDTVVAGPDGDAEGIAEGAVVLVRSHRVDGEIQAREIIVLPESSTYGIRAAAGDSDD